VKRELELNSDVQIASEAKNMSHMSKVELVCESHINTNTNSNVNQATNVQD